MRIVIAPDSFKESLSALQVAQAIEQGFKEIFPQANYITLPMADGGEGTVDALVAATGGKRILCTVTDPLGQPVEAFFGLLGDGKTAVIEMAAASGLHLVPIEQRNPLITTSYGTGELILAALEHDVQQLILGIGGSATNDGGAGMMQALGANLQDGDGRILPFGGAALSRLENIELTGLDPRLNQLEITVACDVNNPLCGKLGASAVFSPQKGATPEMVNVLDSALHHYGLKIESLMGKNVIDAAGAGAAGGMGASLLGCLGAKLRSGIEIIIDTLKLEETIQGADLVITGEGRIDSQTIHGKTPIGVARVAQKLGVPTIALVGGMSRDYGAVHQHGIDAVFSIVPEACSLSDALAHGAENLRVTARNVAAVWSISH
ncbi:glycerate kinase [Xenorhabdus nematophila]|uniref:glycerate kinase n=1 Tax=Xenorhabdus nematophila TaxID=628 RepID=UPI000542E04B|nr:glycerate kinase [Xenorhabdus nematophila]CEE91547.1 glycerate kinase I [Xenorhabdus nematophila str. Anatoliense]CEF30035.1 glycerate kinase I [Xenorhabdus nematophila str. Websteri]AYA41200.1 glycerate kinase [Xenorhabdus nematophila]KHD27616.1 glycerate kinase [Xenorhabdus nematophila]MBA0019941.1 glycerate kinase [Xenorhabdus nematophila]